VPAPASANPRFADVRLSTGVRLRSMGSFVAQQAALAAPERIAGLVLIGSATAVRNEVTLERFLRTAPS
jgi:pimeloyl-ACP methyl ester carboxylesterase